MKNEYFDVPATRGAMRFRNSFTGNPMGDYLLGYVVGPPALQRLGGGPAALGDHASSSRTTGRSPRTSLEPRPPLRLHHPALEAQNAQTNFDPAGTGSLVFASDGSLEERGLVKPDRNNFAPRVGVVYKLNEKTILRGGFGIFYNLFDRVGSEDQLALNVPGLINTSVTQTSGSPVFFLQNGFPASFLTPPNLDPAAGQLRACASARCPRTRPRPPSTRRAWASSASWPETSCSPWTASTPRARTSPPW